MTKHTPGPWTCPECGGDCERDEVDNGVGMEACGPWGCPECHWVQRDDVPVDDPVAAMLPPPWIDDPDD